MSNYDRVYNFSAGPSVLPLEVLEKVQKELLNYDGSGQSVMEMSHRSKEYQKIIDEAEANLRELMHIPDNYKVLFVQGGGTLQFAMVPMNLLRNSKKADYVITGTWAKKAYKEAGKFGDIRVIASSEEIDVSKFGLIWAGAQKNVAPAGVSIVIIREDLLGYAGTEIPTYLDYKIHCRGKRKRHDQPGGSSLPGRHAGQHL